MLVFVFVCVCMCVYVSRNDQLRPLLWQPCKCRTHLVVGAGRHEVRVLQRARRLPKRLVGAGGDMLRDELLVRRDSHCHARRRERQRRQRAECGGHLEEEHKSSLTWRVVGGWPRQDPKRGSDETPATGLVLNSKDEKTTIGMA